LAQQVTDVNLSTLLNEIENNKVRASQFYNNKTLRLSGVVGMIDTDNSLTLYASNSDWDSIWVYFNSSERAKLLNLNKGQTITIRGVYDGPRQNIRNAVIE